MASIQDADITKGEEGAEWTGKPWLGKWESIPEKDENLEEFLKAIGVDMSHPDMRKDKPVGLRTFKMGDEYHHKIVVKEAGYVNDVVFKLGQECPGTYKGQSYSVKYEEKNGALVGTVKYPSHNKVINNTYKMDGQNLMKTAECDGVVHKRSYNKKQN